MNKKTRMLEADTDKNNEKLDDIPGEINRIKKAIRRRRQTDRELSLRVDELKNLITDIRNNKHALNNFTHRRGKKSS